MKKRTLIIICSLIFLLIVGITIFFIPKKISPNQVKSKIEKIAENYQRNLYETVNSFPDVTIEYNYEKQHLYDDVTQVEKMTYYVTKKGKDDTLYLKINDGQNSLEYYISDGMYIVSENNQTFQKEKSSWEMEVAVSFITILLPTKNENNMLDANLLKTDLTKAVQQGFTIKVWAETEDISIEAAYDITKNYFKSYFNTYRKYEDGKIVEKVLRNYKFKYN